MSLLLLFSQPPYHQSLLSAADQLVASEPAVAVVTAHMACEIVVEQLVSAAFKSRGIPDLEDAVTALFASNNLANDRVREVYVALTGDAIQSAPFWQRFKESSSVRNGAVHHGKRVSADQAKESCAVARDLIAHLESIGKALAHA
jgi:hypothetical protein